MVTLTPREGRSARHRIADELRQKILLVEDGLTPGVLLPSENRLAEQYGVSRPTLREALSILRGEGLLETTVGQGTKVTRRPPPEPDITEQAGAPLEVAGLLGLVPGAPVTRRRQILYRDDQPVKLVLTYTREQVA
jgi:GntR family transcriptional regulator